MGELVPRHPGNRFTVCSSARLQKSTGNPDCHASVSRLPGDEEHDPAEHDGRDGEEHEAVDAVADHAPGRVAQGDAEDGGSKEGTGRALSKHRLNQRHLSGLRLSACLTGELRCTTSTTEINLSD